MVKYYRERLLQEVLAIAMTTEEPLVFATASEVEVQGESKCEAEHGAGRPSHLEFDLVVPQHAVVRTQIIERFPGIHPSFHIFLRRG